MVAQSPSVAVVLPAAVHAVTSTHVNLPTLARLHGLDGQKAYSRHVISLYVSLHVVLRTRVLS